MKSVYGSRLGLKASQIKRLENLGRRRVSPQAIVSYEVCRDVCALSMEIGRQIGLLIDRQGKVVPYALYNLEPRGRLFVQPGEPVYEGMVIGEHNREQDINVNPTKEKKLTNMRASGKDDNVILAPIRPMTLEQAINFIRDDEYVEVTPQSIRLRKVTLGAKERYVQRDRKNK